VFGNRKQGWYRRISVPYWDGDFFVLNKTDDAIHLKDNEF